jgi:hypothetical protein
MPTRSKTSSQSKAPFPVGTRVRVNYEYGDGTAHNLLGTLVATTDDRFVTIAQPSNNPFSIPIARIYWIAVEP